MVFVSFVLGQARDSNYILPDGLGLLSSKGLYVVDVSRFCLAFGLTCISEACRVYRRGCWAGEARKVNNKYVALRSTSPKL